MDAFINQALGENVDELVEKSKKKTNRILEDEDLDALFHLS